MICSVNIVIKVSMNLLMCPLSLAKHRHIVFVAMFWSRVDPLGSLVGRGFGRFFLFWKFVWLSYLFFFSFFIHFVKELASTLISCVFQLFEKFNVFRDFLPKHGCFRIPMFSKNCTPEWMYRRIWAIFRLYLIRHIDCPEMVPTRPYGSWLTDWNISQDP